MGVAGVFSIDSHVYDYVIVLCALCIVCVLVCSYTHGGQIQMHRAIVKNE